MSAAPDAAPAERPGLLLSAQAQLPRLPDPSLNPAPVLPDDPEPEPFDWFEEESVIVERQPSIAVYRNPRGHVVIRGEGHGYDEEDAFIYLATPDAIKALIVALQRELREGGR